ncbi:hypothetical protein [Azospirillum baldaniorum]|uniref:hypothetical protein n=1 Tax=Azospirillum baldaniorum TaxID=1064539 RepID=UPI00119F773E|nr:hypothetical protein [Azospirillum baldaniorum]
MTRKLLNRTDGAISQSFPNRGLIFVNATAVRRIAQRSNTSAAQSAAKQKLRRDITNTSQIQRPAIAFTSPMVYNTQIMKRALAARKHPMVDITEYITIAEAARLMGVKE